MFFDGIVSDSSTEEIYPESWPKWARQFKQIFLASELSKKEKYQINTLFFAMGDTAEDILHSFCLTDKQLKSYEAVLAKF